ncbi:MAG: hypothetical protein RLZZ301_1125 [Bacteroidota bacterium]|jgi:hypothetical protein
MKAATRIVLFATLFFVQALHAQQKTIKGLEALKQDNFGIALQAFRSDQLKHPFAANFGLSQYYQSSYAFELDSAFYYLNQAEILWKQQDDKQRLKDQTKLYVSDSLFALQFLKLANTQLQQAKQAASLPALANFSARFGARFEALNAQANQCRDSVAFELALQAHQSEALFLFIENYPQAKQVPAAQKLYEDYLFYEKTQAQTESVLNAFIQDYPSNPHVAEAWQQLYALTQQSATLTAYEHFVRAYPAAPQYQEAWKQIYRLFMQEYSLNRLAQFKENYPDYPHIDELNRDGELLLMTLYPWIEDGKYGYINQEGQLLIAAEYDEANSFIDGVAIVAKNQKYGLIDKKNQLVVPFIYDELFECKDQRCIARQNELLGVVSQAGRVELPLVFKDIQRLENGNLLLEDSVGFRLMASSGQWIIERAQQFEEMQHYLAEAPRDTSVLSTGNVNVVQVFQKNGKFGLKAGAVVLLQAQYEVLLPIVNQPKYFVAKYRNELQVLDEKGKKIIPAGFEWFAAAPNQVRLEEGLICLSKRGKWGLLDVTSKTVLPFEFDAIRFVAGLGFVVERLNEIGVFRAAQNFVVPIRYEQLKLFEKNYIMVSLNAKDGLLDLNGKEILPTAFQRIARFDAQTLVLYANGALCYFLEKESRILTRKS